MNRHIESILFTEKYRPQNLNDIILPDRIKKRFSNGLQSNILCFGSAGSGKSSLARLLVKQFDHPDFYINCSKDSSVDFIRQEITNFAMVQSMKTMKHANTKVIILDELDGASAQFYKALRASMEEFAHVRFIGTCNYINKIPDALQQRRFDLIDFNFTEADERELKRDYARRLLMICKAEELTIDKTGLENLIKKFFPDMGAMLNLLQGFKTENRTTITGEDIKRSHSVFQNLFGLIFNDNDADVIFKTVMENYQSKIDSILSACFSELPAYILNEKIEYKNLLPAILIKVAEYQSKKNQIIDIPLVAIALLYDLQQLIKNFKV